MPAIIKRRYRIRARGAFFLGATGENGWEEPIEWEGLPAAIIAAEAFLWEAPETRCAEDVELVDDAGAVMTLAQAWGM